MAAKRWKSWTYLQIAKFPDKLDVAKHLSLSNVFFLFFLWSEAISSLIVERGGTSSVSVLILTLV